MLSPSSEGKSRLQKEYIIDPEVVRMRFVFAEKIFVHKSGKSEIARLFWTFSPWWTPYRECLGTTPVTKWSK